MKHLIGLAIVIAVPAAMICAMVNDIGLHQAARGLMIAVALIATASAVAWMTRGAA